MQRPSDFDSVREYSDSYELTPGGHFLVIKNIEETKSKAGADMVVIWFDTAEKDVQPGYYADKWDNDTRDKDKKTWGGRAWQLVNDPQSPNNTNRGFKTFITAVTESNPGFEVQWGDKFCECFKGKLVGGVFRREEYVKQDGNTGWSVKCMSFRSVQTIENGVKVPEDKYLSGSAQRPAASSGGMIVQPDDDDYPF